MPPKYCEFRNPGFPPWPNKCDQLITHQVMNTNLIEDNSKRLNDPASSLSDARLRIFYWCADHADLLGVGPVSFRI